MELGEAAPKPALYERLGTAYAAVGDKDQAVREYRIAAAAYANQSDPAKATDLLSRVATLEPGDLEPGGPRPAPSSAPAAGSTMAQTETGTETTGSTGNSTDTTTTYSGITTGNLRHSGKHRLL